MSGRFADRRGSANESVVVALIGLVCVLTWPVSANAGTLSFDGTKYIFTAAPGETNLTAAVAGTSPGQLAFTDNAPVTPDSSAGACSFSPNGTLVCPWAPAVVYNLSDGNDKVRGGPVQDIYYLGPGEDIVYGGGPGSDVLNGGPGNDVFYQTNGGASADRTDSSGGDTFIGEDGTDAVRYAQDSEFSGVRTTPLELSLDGGANDGEPGEGDNIQSGIEEVMGGIGPDVITGSDAADQLNGFRGQDTIYGRGGNDKVDGSEDDDRLYGEAGNDTVYGSGHNDFLDGGPGSDSLIADCASGIIGLCTVGNDEIQAADGFPDSLSCGIGADAAVIDQLDTLPADSSQACEAITRKNVGGGASGSAVSIKTSRTIKLRVLLRQGLSVEIICPAACSIDAGIYTSSSAARKFRLSRSKLRRIGRARKKLQSAGTAKFRIKPTARARRGLRRVHRLSLSLRTTVSGSGLPRTTKTTKVGVRR